MQRLTTYARPVLGSTLVVGSILASLPSATAQERAGEPLEEIVVTAQKRSEVLREVPMSVTVLSGDTLQRVKADNFQDMVALIPGLSITSATRGVTRLTLRGANTGGVASTVGVYVGDVPFGSSSGLANAAILAGDFDTYDMSRMEVLRGPQGTLYGASSLAGVVKYVPNPASTEAFEGGIEGSVETVRDADPGYAVTGALNVPLSDQFAVRATGFYRSDEGFIDTIGNNPIPALQDPSVNVIEGTLVQDDINTVDTYGGRVQALFEPGENFSLNLMAMVQDIDSGAPNTVDGDPATLAELNADPVQSRYHEQFTDIAYRVYSGSLAWDFDAATLESVTSFGSFEQDFQVDAAIAAPLTGGLPLSSLLTLIFDDPTTPEVAPLLSAILPQITATDKWTQEFRLISPESVSFEWLIGAYYTDEESVIDQTILAVEPGTQNQVAGFPLLAVAQINSTYEEIALFANATWHLSSQLEVSFGARQSDNDQSAVQTTDGPLAGGAPMEISGGSSESPFTWSFSPRYQFSDDTSAYLRIATGFRPGGPNVVPPTAPPGVPTSYDSDELTSYEIGLKTSRGRFALEVAGYFLDWEDIQLIATVEGFNVNTNGGTAESMGAEFAASFSLTDNLSLSVNGAYTDAELTQNTSAQLGGLDGDPLPFVPEWSFGLSADYEWAVGAGSEAYVGGNLGYTGERAYDFDVREPDGSLSEVDSYTTVNLRAGLSSGRWELEIYGKNVTDESGISSVGTENTPATGRVDLGVIWPRTYGLTIGMKF